MHDVIIIGAGAAGLAAGQALRAAGYTPLILEARDRIGGRIWTDQTHGPVELGAEFIHGDRAATWPAVRAAGLRTVGWGPDRRFAVGGRILPEDDPLAGRVNRLYEAATSYHGPEISTAALLRSMAAPDDPALTIALRWLANMEGADPARLSALALTREREMSTNGERNFHIVEGYDRVVAQLAEGLDIRLGAPVARVVWGADGVTAHLAADSAEGLHRQRAAPGVKIPEARLGPQPSALGAAVAGGEALAARQVLVTAPITLLAAALPAFDPPLPAAKQRALGAIAMGHVTKLVLWFDRQLWPDFTVLSTDGAIATWWPVETAAVPTLMGYSGGQVGLEVAALGAERAIAAGLADLSALFGVDARAACIGGRLADWSRDPWSRGAYSYSPLGMGAARADLAAPLGAAVFFAGEATVLDGHIATVHGAIESGRRAAAELIQTKL